jgi:DNA (cytosine-5)-methyltransferase 1
MVRIVDLINPLWIVAENVPGLVSSRGGEDFETILRSLTKRGYGMAWAILNSRHFGVPQNRPRVFIVGRLGGIPRPEVVTISEGLFGDPPPRRRRRQPDPAGSPRRLGINIHPATGQGSELNITEADIASTLTASDGKMHERGTRIVTFAQNTRDEVRVVNDVAGAVAARPGHKQQTFLAIDDGDVRRFTPTERERLQGFPDGWTDTPGNFDTYRIQQLGNAVTVPVAQYIFENLIADHRRNP